MQDERAEHARGDRAERQKDRDARGCRVAERPEPQEVADAAAQPMNATAAQATNGKMGRGVEEALEGGQDGQKEHRGEHGDALTGSAG